MGPVLIRPDTVKGGALGWLPSGNAHAKGGRFGH